MSRSSSMMTSVSQAPPTCGIQRSVASAEECETARLAMAPAWRVEKATRVRKDFSATGDEVREGSVYWQFVAEDRLWDDGRLRKSV